MKAVVSITLDDEFAVHDIKIIEGEKGLFIAMPSRKTTDGEYRDIAHPINSETRDRIQKIILEKYEEVLEQDVTVLIPAALELQITAKNADKIKAKMIVEAANGPTDAEADVILEKRGIPVVPDVLANGGGVTVSYFEWVQNLYRYFWTEEEVIDRQEQMMVKAFGNVYDAAKKYNTTMRVGAYIVALNALVEPLKLRGII